MDDNIFTTNIEQDTLENKFFRKVLYTSKNQQLVVMSIKPKQDIPFEIHPNHDQFFRIEKGHGIAFIGKNKEKQYHLYDGSVIIVPANTYHQIVNASDSDDLQLYTIYSPPEHPPNRIDITRPQTGSARKSKYQEYKARYLKLKNKNL